MAVLLIPMKQCVHRGVVGKSICFCRLDGVSRPVAHDKCTGNDTRPECPFNGDLDATPVPLKIPPPGVGTILARMIREKWGDLFFDGCGCGSHIAQMNNWGPDGCRENRATIVQWLIEGLQKALAADTAGKLRWVQRVPERVRRWYLGRLVDAAVREAERG